MKKIILLISLGIAFLCSSTYAAVFTVSNNNAIPAEYTSLQTAINTAAEGDTIYVAYSSRTYGTITINKKVYLFGYGYNGDSTGKATILTRLYLNKLDENTNCSQSRIEGFKIEEIESKLSDGDAPITNLSFLRCHITNHLQYFNDVFPNVHNLHSSWYFKDCIIDYLLFANGSSEMNNGAENMVFSNCIFTDKIQYCGNNTTYRNCLFLYNSNGFSYISHADFENCIFYDDTPRTIENSTFDNCLTYNTDDDQIPYGSNNGSNNIVGEDPMFIDYNSTFNYLVDFNLDENSPAKNAGKDGTDLGIFGGNAPMKDLTGMPHIPIITDVLIYNPNVGKNGSLRFRIKAKNNN